MVTNDGRFTFVVNTGAGLPAPVTFFGLSPSGALSPLGPAATASSAGEFARTDAALSRDSKYLYVLAPWVGPGAPSHIDEYQLSADGEHEAHRLDAGRREPAGMAPPDWRRVSG